MADTQWPRYIVFHQTKEGQPHEYSGSVHAPDSEIAMMNARDVFVRRPECVSLWIVRADKIFAKTAEELASQSDVPPTESQSIQHYHVFQKIGHRAVNRHIGEVTASSPEHALTEAQKSYPNQSAVVWWVFPVKAVRASQPEDIEIMFAQAWDKTDFRDQSEFHTVATMKKLKSEVEATDES